MLNHVQGLGIVLGCPGAWLQLVHQHEEDLRPRLCIPKLIVEDLRGLTVEMGVPKKLKTTENAL